MGRFLMSPLGCMRVSRESSGLVGDGRRTEVEVICMCRGIGDCRLGVFNPALGTWNGTECGGSSPWYVETGLIS